MVIFNLPRLSVDIDMDYIPNGTKDEMAVAIDRLTFQKIRRDLFPVLRKKENFDLEERKTSARKYISDLMQVTKGEMEYMEVFERKEYRPELLFDNPDILKRIENHPMALWKCKE